MNKVTEETVVKVETVANKSGKGEHPVVTLNGHKYPYNIKPALKDIFKGPGKFKIEWVDTEYNGKTYENIANAEMLSSLAPAEVAKAVTATKATQDKGMTYSSAINATKDIVIAFLTSAKFEKDTGADSEDAPTEAQYTVTFTRDILQTFLNELDSRNGVKVD